MRSALTNTLHPDAAGRTGRRRHHRSNAPAAGGRRPGAAGPGRARHPHRRPRLGPPTPTRSADVDGAGRCRRPRRSTSPPTIVVPVRCRTGAPPTPRGWRSRSRPPPASPAGDLVADVFESLARQGIETRAVTANGDTVSCIVRGRVERPPARPRGLRLVRHAPLTVPRVRCGGTDGVRPRPDPGTRDFDPMDVLAIDLGTSGVKVAVFDDRGHGARLGQPSRLTTRHTEPAAARNRTPSEWWTAIGDAAHEARRGRRRPAGGIGAVAVTSQYMSTVAVDPTGRPISPVIMWMDHRGGALHPVLARRRRVLRLARPARPAADDATTASPISRGSAPGPDAGRTWCDASWSRSTPSSLDSRAGSPPPRPRRSV